MRTKLGRIVCVLAIMLVAVSGHGESGLRRSLAVHNLEAEPDLALMTQEGCPKNDAAWVDWREQKIRRLLRLSSPSYERWVDGKWTKVLGDDPYLDLEAVMQRATKIAEFLDRCPGPVPIVGNLRKFVTTQRNASYLSNNPQHQFGHQDTDATYLERAADALTLPCLLRSPDFLNAISKPETYRHALEMIREHNEGKAGHDCPAESTQWTTLLFRSRFISTPDDANTFGRLLVVAPGGDYDRWIQFGIWTPEDLASGKPLPIIRNVSIVAVARNAGQAGSAQFDAIADFFRCEDAACGQDAKLHATPPCPGAASGIALCSRLAVTKETDNCERCHKMMPNSIHPEHVYDFGVGNQWHVLDDQAAEAAVERINSMIGREYARLPLYKVPPDKDDVAAWQNYGAIGMGADPTSFGQDERSPQSIKACAATVKVALTDDSAQRVETAMNCSSCHGARTKGPSLGVLNYPLATEKRLSGPILEKSGEVHTPNVIESHILRGLMPLRKAGGRITEARLDLSDDERKALYACLSDEYFHPSQDHVKSPSGLFVDWLRNQGGDGEPPPSTFAVKTPATPAGKSAAGKNNLLVEPGMLVPGDGQQDFTKHCARCHEVVPGKTGDGPNLFGVFGRRMGADAQFAQAQLYSDGMMTMAANPKLTWTQENLMAFVADPTTFVNTNSGRQDGSTMEPRFSDSVMRQRVVDYLKTLK